MCNGETIVYRCCRKKQQTVYDMCENGPWSTTPHLLIGRTIYRARACDSCRGHQRREQQLHQWREAAEAAERNERLKARMEFDRGERPWPEPDCEVDSRFWREYDMGTRLHPYRNHGIEENLNAHRRNFEGVYRRRYRFAPSGTGERVFQMMLDRQVEIDRTGRPVTNDDRRLRLSDLIEYEIEMTQEEMEGNANPERESEVLRKFSSWVLSNIDVVADEDPGSQLVQLRSEIDRYFVYVSGFDHDITTQIAILTGGAVLQADRFQYDYISNAPTPNSPVSFRQWIVANDLADTDTTMEAGFSAALSGYRTYLEAGGWMVDHQFFLGDRRNRIYIMRELLARMPDISSIREGREILRTHEGVFSPTPLNSVSLRYELAEDTATRFQLNLVQFMEERAAREESLEETRRENQREESVHENQVPDPPHWDPERVTSAARTTAFEGLGEVSPSTERWATFHWRTASSSIPFDQLTDEDLEDEDNDEEEEGGGLLIGDEVDDIAWYQEFTPEFLQELLQELQPLSLGILFAEGPSLGGDDELEEALEAILDAGRDASDSRVRHQVWQDDVEFDELSDTHSDVESLFQL